jgi:DEAD/DEAH box helicase domain-containing protein
MTQAVLQEARIEGVWSNLNERVIEGAGYFRSVEHSAQQSGSRLELYESEFKQGLDQFNELFNHHGDGC